jgi:hypothetical protein
MKKITLPLWIAALSFFSANGWALENTERASRLACGLELEYSDEEGHPIQSGNSDPRAVRASVVVTPPASVREPQVWELQAESSLASFKVKWTYGHTCVVRMMPGCSSDYVDQRPGDYLRDYSIELTSAEDKTVVALAHYERDFDLKVGAVVDTPRLKLKLKTPILDENSTHRKLFITSIYLRCYRGYWN